MRGQWNLREWEREYLVSLFTKHIDTLKNTLVDKIDLTDEDICPENVIDILEILGYEYDDVDTNGWEQDTWIQFVNQDTGHELTLFYCGRTFKIELYPTIQED